MIGSPGQILVLIGVFSSVRAIVFQPTVVRGTIAGRHEFPSVIYIQSGGQYVCTGTLINGDTVLTAKHCAKQSRSGWGVAAGVYRVYEMSRTPGVQQRRVIQKIPFPNSTVGFSNDVMLLKLESPIDESSTIRYARLPTESNNFPAAGTNCFIVGYGKIQASGAFSRMLWKGQIRAMPKEGYDPSVILGKPRGPNSPSGCLGDSGGPLLCAALDSGDPFQVGTVSEGDGTCGSETGLVKFGRVSYFLRWIQANTVGLHQTCSE